MDLDTRLNLFAITAYLTLFGIYFSAYMVGLELLHNQEPITGFTWVLVFVLTNWVIRPVLIRYGQHLKEEDECSN